MKTESVWIKTKTGFGFSTKIKRQTSLNGFFQNIIIFKEKNWRRKSFFLVHLSGRGSSEEGWWFFFLDLLSIFDPSFHPWAPAGAPGRWNNSHSGPRRASTTAVSELGGAETPHVCVPGAVCGAETAFPTPAPVKDDGRWGDGGGGGRITPGTLAQSVSSSDFPLSRTGGIKRGRRGSKVWQESGRWRTGHSSGSFILKGKRFILEV